jgi:hypothetical protein
LQPLRIDSLHLAGKAVLSAGQAGYSQMVALVEQMLNLHQQLN